MITDAELTALGLNGAQITNLKTAIDSQVSKPHFRCILHQYAPEWESKTALPSSPWSQLDCAIDSNLSILVSVCNGSTGSTYELDNEDSVDHGWSFYGNFAVGYSPVSSSVIYDGGTIEYFFVPASSNLVRYGTSSSFSAPGISTAKYVAAISYTDVHFIGLTAQGNWKLAYWDGSTVTESEIYWPYRVRSFDAIRHPDGYDIIAMITDLPPIADYTTSGTKMVKAEQWVQGIVLFKFDPTTKQWSDHFEFDVADNHDEVVRANVKLTAYGNELYMVYAKEYSGQVGLAITRSADGLAWENPIFYTSFFDGTGIDAVGETYPVQLLRSGKHMYLIGGNLCQRADSTDFMGTAVSSLTLDVTKYVTNISGSIATQRTAMIDLADPQGVLTGSSLLSKIPIGLIADIEVGYYTASGTITIPVLKGVVTDAEPEVTLPVKHLRLTVKDPSALIQMVGTPEAQEWQGLRFGGDDFSPTISEDTVGSSGLNHIAVHSGSWVGGNTSTGKRPIGLNMKCNSEEGIALSTFMSRSYCGFLCSEISFYKEMSLLDFTGGTPSETLSSAKSEYAGLAFRVMNDNNLYYLRFKPGGASANYNYFQLVRRDGFIEWWPPDHAYRESFDDVAVGTEYSIDRGASPTYSKWYSGRLWVEWRYHLIRVYRREPGGTPVKIIEYEVPGMGTHDFNDSLYASVRSRMAGSVGYLAYSPKDGYINISQNGTGEQDYTPPLDYWLTQSGGTIESVTSPLRPGSEVTRVIHVTTGTETGNNPGAIYDTGTGLAVAGDTALRFSCYLYLAAGDTGNTDETHCSVRMRAVLRYTDEVIEKTAWTTVTGPINGWIYGWVPVEWTTTTATGKLLDRIEVFFNDGRTPAEINTTTSWYISEFEIGKKGNDSYVYFGNVDCSDMYPAYTVQDAAHNLYSYAGQLHNTKRMLLDDHFTSNTGEWTASSMTLETTGNGRMHGLGTALTKRQIPLPLICEAKVNSTTGRIYLRGATNPCAWFEWTTTYVELNVYYDATHNFTRRIPFPTIPVGSSLRLVCTTQINEGTLAKKSEDGTTKWDWMTIAVWADDHLLISGSAPIKQTTNYLQTVGFGSYDGLTEVDIDRFSVQELHRTVPYFSIDPGESPSGGLGRLVGAGRLVPLYRYNGGLRLGRRRLGNVCYQSGGVTFGAHTISDSNSGLGGYTVGDILYLECPEVAANDSRFVTVTVVAAGQLTISETLTVQASAVTARLYTVLSISGKPVIKTGEAISMVTPAHIRLVGAWDEKDIFDTNGMNKTWRHTFTKKDDPNLITSYEMETEADYLLADLQAGTERLSVETGFNPLWEYADYAVYDNQHYYLDNLEWSLQKGQGEAIVMKAQLSLNRVD